MTTDKALRRHVSAALEACKAWSVPVGDPCLYRPPLSEPVSTTVRSKPFEVCGEAVILIAASPTAVPLWRCQQVPSQPSQEVGDVQR